MNSDILIEALEPLIIKGKLKKLDNSTFKEISKLFNTEDKLPILHALIVHLDLSILDASELVSLCLETELYLGLIYICTQGNDDFITPLVKLTATY